MYRLFAVSFLLLTLFTVRFAVAQQPAKKSKAGSKTTIVPQKKHKSTDTVGVVNGRAILLYDYKGLLSDIIQKAAHDSVVTDDDFTKYVDAAWDKAVEDILVEQEIEKRKLTMSDSAVLAITVADPPDFLIKQFTDSSGSLHREALLSALTDTRNDSVAKIILGVERINLEHMAFINAIAPGARNQEERSRTYQIWLKEKKAKARIDDRRIAFGYY